MKSKIEMHSHIMEQSSDSHVSARNMLTCFWKRDIPELSLPTIIWQVNYTSHGKAE